MLIQKPIQVLLSWTGQRFLRIMKIFFHFLEVLLFHLLYLGLFYVYGVNRGQLNAKFKKIWFTISSGSIKHLGINYKKDVFKEKGDV